MTNTTNSFVSGSFLLYLFSSIFVVFYDIEKIKKEMDKCRAKKSKEYKMWIYMHN